MIGRRTRAARRRRGRYERQLREEFVTPAAVAVRPKPIELALERFEVREDLVQGRSRNQVAAWGEVVGASDDSFKGHALRRTSAEWT